MLTGLLLERSQQEPKGLDCSWVRQLSKIVVWSSVAKSGDSIRSILVLVPCLAVAPASVSCAACPCASFCAVVALCAADTQTLTDQKDRATKSDQKTTGAKVVKPVCRVHKLTRVLGICHSCNVLGYSRSAKGNTTWQKT